MVSVSNAFVDYLSRYTTASPDHESAFDEFLAQSPPPTGRPLRLETRVESFLKACFTQPDPPSVILTGNAGDGKTYLCRQILTTLGMPGIDWETLADRPAERGGLYLHVVKDLSELGDERGIEVLRGLAASLQQATPDRYLIAANEGRLRDLIGRTKAELLYQEVERQLQHGTQAGSQRLIVINLTEVSTSSFVPTVLGWMTHPEHWSTCSSCPILERCPVRHNVGRLREPFAAQRVQLLYQILEHLDIHVTVRDMLIHLAFTITGNRRCAELQRQDAALHDQSRLAYYINIWGGEQSGTFFRKASVAQHLSRLRVGDHSLFEIDDFIVNGADHNDHKTIFTSAVDLNFRRFSQDRAAYVEGGAEHPAADEARAMLGWLPHCRRKLFFEWHDTARSNRLIAFHYLDDYLQLLEDERGRHDQVIRSLVLGLNRSFSRLYLVDSDMLYVTTQYLHSAEQSRPLVRLSIPVGGITLHVDRRPEYSFDRTWPDLYLVIGAPPALLLRDPGAASRQQRWPLNLLLFEYLMRLAHGGTFNILAEECELVVRSLKDQLLSAFSQEPVGSSTIEFFVAERRKYVLKKLRVDEQGSIRSGG